MRIISGENPDAWFEPSDLYSGSIIAIRRESVTCCGFLGGDSIMIISSGAAFAEFLIRFRPVLPWNQRNGICANPSAEKESRTARVLSKLKGLDTLGNEGPAADISAWDDLFTDISDTIWFAGSKDPYRFSFDLIGDIQTFLTGPIYPARLLSCLHWWFLNEATEEERGRYLGIPLIRNLIYPEHLEVIIRAINLYNHGTYEVANR